MLQNIQRFSNPQFCFSSFKIYNNLGGKSKGFSDHANRLILVDMQDRQVGTATKEDCHRLLWNDSEFDPFKLPLHRAFSLLAFTRDRILVQRRASSKQTFASRWSNSCCSHPIADSLLTVEDQLKKRSKEEIGLVPKNLNFIGRIHYAAIDPALLTPGLDSGEAYGEHEVDHVFWTIFDDPIESLQVNKEEVSEIGLWTKDELKNRLETKSDTFTPWFRALCNEYLLELSWTRDSLLTLRFPFEITELCRYKGPLV